MEAGEQAWCAVVFQWITTPRGPSNRRSPGELGASFGEAWCKLRPSLRQASSLDKLQNAATHLGFSCRNLGSPDPLLRTLTIGKRGKAI